MTVVRQPENEELSTLLLLALTLARSSMIRDLMLSLELTHRTLKEDEPIRWILQTATAPCAGRDPFDASLLISLAQMQHFVRLPNCCRTSHVCAPHASTTASSSALD
jgi:hypothetical protein